MEIEETQHFLVIQNFWKPMQPSTYEDALEAAVNTLLLVIKRVKLKE